MSKVCGCSDCTEPNEDQEPNEALKDLMASEAPWSINKIVVEIVEPEEDGTSSFLITMTPEMVEKFTQIGIARAIEDVLAWDSKT